MANTIKSQVFLCFVLLLTLSSSLSVVRAVDRHPLKICNFDAIYQLGDSILDTGNLVRENKLSPAGSLPYGETFFTKPTGRWSNGRLMIDFFAMAADLPFLNPYLNKEADFKHGVNFAVAGSTALSSSILASKNISSEDTNSSLNVQLDWMFSHFNSTCHSNSDCAKKHKNALFMVGETGGNDYNYALQPRIYSTQELKSILVPNIVQAIMDAVKHTSASVLHTPMRGVQNFTATVWGSLAGTCRMMRVISYGAVRMVVPGNFPIGCIPVYLTIFKTNDSSAYDKYHCLKELNEFSKYHNDKLQQGIKKLQRENPNVTIVYGDYYNAYQWIFQNAQSLRFDHATLLKACCGVGGDYNVGTQIQCGGSDIPICTNPHSHISWDGVHSTEQVYKFMTQWLTRDILPKLKC